MRAGRLRHRVTIQQQSTSQDSYGQRVETWTDVDTVWAAVEPIKGKEYFESKQVNAEVTIKVIMRYRTGINPSMRIFYDNRYFDILEIINPEERNKELHLMCKEVI